VEATESAEPCSAYFETQMGVKAIHEATRNVISCPFRVISWIVPVQGKTTRNQTTALPTDELCRCRAALFGFYALCIIWVFALSAPANLHSAIFRILVNGTRVVMKTKHKRVADCSEPAQKTFIN